MTGQGRAQKSSDLGTASAEIRTVNHRAIKISSRTSDSLSALTPKIEALVRSRIHRGSIHLQTNWKPASTTTACRIDQPTLIDYHRQLVEARDEVGANDPIEWSSLLQLPGVVVSNETDQLDLEQLWSVVEPVVSEAVDRLQEMRTDEGAAMVASLRKDLAFIRSRVDLIATETPSVAEKYRERLTAKIRKTLSDHDLNVDQIDLLREVQLYADRVDVSEEITRLSSHLQLVENVLNGDEGDDSSPASNVGDVGNANDPVGRKLDFIVQEMFRETNTIGSKASDATISTYVVDVKCALERMRELVQNLE